MLKENFNAPARATVFYAVGNAFSKIVGIATTPIFTRILSEKEYGDFAFYICIVAIIGGIVAPLCSGGAVYRGLLEFSDRRGEYLFSVGSILCVFSAAVFFVLFFLKRTLKFNDTVIILLAIQTFFDALTLLMLTSHRFTYSYKAVTAVTITDAILSPIFALFFIKVTHLGFWGRVLGMLLSSAIIALPLFVSVLKEKKSVSQEICLFTVKNSVPLLLNSSLGALGGQADRLLLSFLLGSTAIAKYSVAHSIGAGLGFISASILGALSPWISRRLRLFEYERVSEVVFIIFKILCLGACILSALSPEAMRLLAPNNYYSALYAIPPIALSTAVAFLNSVSTVVTILSKRSFVLSVSRLVSLFGGSSFGFLLIPTFGFFGAGAALLIGELCAAAVNLYFLGRQGISGILPVRQLFGAFVLTVSLSGVFSSLQAFPAIRILLLIIPSLLLLNTLTAGKKYLFEISN